MFGTIENYFWYDFADIDFKEILISLDKDLKGLRAINTSFDSGLYKPNENDFHAGWELINHHAVSPLLTAFVLSTFPQSHEAYCDEWWFFSQVPINFSQVPAFCNYISNRIQDWQKLEFEKGAMLNFNLKKYNPKFVLGNNEWTYLVSQKNYQNIKKTKNMKNRKKIEKNGITSR